MLNLHNIFMKNVLENLDLSVQNGEFVLIVGANGSGKTTLFKVISGALIPDSGRITIKGQDVTNFPIHKRSHWISSVVQDPRHGTIGKMTILENLSIAYMRRKDNKRTKEVMFYFKNKLSILEMGLENRLDEYVENLSGGQRQALSLIMATIADYDVLLLDEITAALDPVMSDIVMNLTNRIVNKQGKSCLLITHNVNHINKFGDKILEMKNGKLVQYR